MTEAKTLLQLSGADLAPARLGDAALILIDLQNEYVKGPIAVNGVEAAIANAARLLAAARKQGTPIFHIAHKGRDGSVFDRDADTMKHFPDQGDIKRYLDENGGVRVYRDGVCRRGLKTDPGCGAKTDPPVWAESLVQICG